MSPEDPADHPSAHSPLASSNGETWIPIAEAALRSGRSTTQFYVWRSKGKSPVRIEEVGGKVCVHADDLRRWTLEHPMRGKSRAAAPRAAAKAEAAKAPAHDVLRPAPRTAASKSFTFRCESGAELRAWAEFLEELAHRGAKVSFRVDGGRITLS